MAVIPQTRAPRSAAAPSADGGRLGNTREICVPPPPGERQIRRFQLLDAARGLLPGERVAGCMRNIVPGRSTVDVMFDPVHKAAHFKGVVTCASAWVCPICAAKISERRKAELQAGLFAHPEYRPVMVTFTLQHRRGDSLQGLLDNLKGGLRFARSGAPWRRVSDRFGIVGSITATEVTWGQSSGWHPHAHVLLLCTRVPSEAELQELQGFLSERFGSWIEEKGGYVSPVHGVKVQLGDVGGADYVAKWGPAHELAKSNQKQGRGKDRLGPWGLLLMASEGDDRAGALFQEYAAAVRGRRVLSYSNGLRDLLAMGQEKTDQELATAEEETSVVLATLNAHQWNMVVGNGARGEVLQVASRGNPEEFWLFLSTLWGFEDSG